MLYPLFTVDYLRALATCARPFDISEELLGRFQQGYPAGVHFTPENAVGIFHGERGVSDWIGPMLEFYRGERLNHGSVQDVLPTWPAHWRPGVTPELPGLSWVSCDGARLAPAPRDRVPASRTPRTLESGEWENEEVTASVCEMGAFRIVDVTVGGSRVGCVVVDGESPDLEHASAFFHGRGAFESAEEYCREHSGDDDVTTCDECGSEDEDCGCEVEE